MARSDCSENRIQSSRFNTTLSRRLPLRRHMQAKPPGSSLGGQARKTRKMNDVISTRKGMPPPAAVKVQRMNRQKPNETLVMVNEGR